MRLGHGNGVETLIPVQSAAEHGCALTLQQRIKQFDAVRRQHWQEQVEVGLVSFARLVSALNMFVTVQSSSVLWQQLYSSQWAILRQGAYVLIGVCFVCLFVGEITQKLINRFPHKLMARWHMGHGRKHWIFGGNPDLDSDPGIFNGIFTTYSQMDAYSGQVGYI